MFLMLNERAKKLASVMSKSGQVMFEKNIRLLDEIIIEIEKKPNGNFTISPSAENSEASSGEIERISDSNDTLTDDDKNDSFSKNSGQSLSEVDPKPNSSNDQTDQTKHDSSDEEILIVPVLNPKGRRKGNTANNKYYKTKSNSNLVNDNLLVENDLCSRLLSNSDTVKSSQLYLTSSIIFCFIETLVKNLNEKIFIFDSINQFNMSKFNCNNLRFWPFCRRESKNCN